MLKEKIKELVSQMTLEEKASLCSGEDFWHTKAVERLGIPKVMVSDGPQGLRKQEGAGGDHLGMGDSIEAVCFPAGCGVAASFNRKLLNKMGETLGNECQAENISVLLGPAMNIKRSPLCGRNFEYYSEDPLLTTELAAAYIRGVQSKNVGTSPKHFLANNQEHRRMTSSSEIDERTLREIYLAAFEGAVKKEKPWTIMASYNRVNGIFVSESRKYLTDVLRKEWNFEGYVISDWGAVNDRVEGLKAGMDLEMPSSKGINDRKIVEAIKCGEVSEEVLNETCERLLNVIFKFVENRDKTAVFDRNADHEVEREIAEESMVLLKNEHILPLSENTKLAFIGKFAKEPRFQGGGSSHIHASKIVSAMDMVEGNNNNIVYAKGYDDGSDEVDEELLVEAVEAAKEAEVAVIFVGLPERYESEGLDREHMKIPECQNALIEAVCQVQPNVVVLLHNGTPVEMPWVDKVKGILECYLGGQAVGEAQVNILFGKVNPSGKLAETFPKGLADNPTHPYYGKEGDVALYREGVLVGYRYYDSKEMDVLFPFGHGLSYTQFEYSDLKVDNLQISDTEMVSASVIVKNTGNIAGQEIVQLYVMPKNSKIVRPVKELKAFDKVLLAPGESKEVTFTLDKRVFAYWNSTIHDWHVETGDYIIAVGKSSRDIVLKESVEVTSTVTIPCTFTKNSTFGDIFEHPEKMGAVMALFAQLGQGEREQKENAEANTPVNPDDVLNQADPRENLEMMKAMLGYSPIRSMVNFMGLPEEMMEQIIKQLNS